MNNEYKCDNCGKPELWGVLCGDCEALCCTECGRVKCVCITASDAEDYRHKLLVYGQCAIKKKG